MKKPFKVEQLVDQSNALTLYLEALLNEVEEEEDDALLLAPTQHTEPDSQTSTPLEQIDTDISLPATAPASIAEEPISVNTSAASVTEFEGNSKDTTDSTTNDRIKGQQKPPAWAVPRFQVLTFSLGNMQMAAPLDKLNGIIPFPDRLTTLPGQSHWYLGLARNRDQNVQVIDLATVIQPHHDLKNGNQGPAENTRYILLFAEGQWGMVCDSISTVLTLETQQVQWQRSRHVDFILGTVIDQMHSVLCIDSLVARLNSNQLV